MDPQHSLQGCSGLAEQSGGVPPTPGPYSGAQVRSEAPAPPSLGEGMAGGRGL